jgi:hypothetical protein
MTATAPSKPRSEASKANVGRLFLLDLSDGRVLSVNPDGTDKQILVTNCRMPDGIVVHGGHIYWTNMGVPSVNDGSIERADLDGGNRTTIVPLGSTCTPKQLQLDKANGKLYWCDREGMRVMRCNLDGSKLETIVDTSRGDTRPGKDQTNWCVGIAVDPERGQFYWTQKGGDDAGQGRIFRASIDMPKGQTAGNRTDIEMLYEGLPEPIDLEIDHKNRLLYWTDRGDPPRGNTVNRAPMDSAAANRPAPQILLTHLMEGIGIALDFRGERLFCTDLAGSVYVANLDGSGKKPILFAQGNLTGIAFVELS